MVVFTCNNCGESVKKSSVEKHCNTKCRIRPISVSCMDCLKDFYGNEYVAHTKCITEVEKYSGKNYIAKEKKSTRQKKQETWMDIVRSILESSEYNLTEEARNIFQRLQNYENVPRKEAKFQNFVANCLKIPSKKAHPVWKVLEKELENMKKIKQEEIAATKTAIAESKKLQDTATKQQNGLKRPIEEDNQNEKVEKKKLKKEPQPEINKENGAGEITEEAASVQWSAILEKIVKKHNEGLPLDKLKKKFLKKYKNKLNLEELSEKQLKKLEKKFSKVLKKCPAVQIENDIVKLN